MLSVWSSAPVGVVAVHEAAELDAVEPGFLAEQEDLVLEERVAGDVGVLDEPSTGS